MYGKSSYDGFPYRHPFVTLHDVVHDSRGARLSEGRLATPQMLIDLMASLGRSLPVEILPERVLVRTAETIVWWTPARERIMFFSDRSNDEALKKMNGRHYPHPPLVFKASGTHLWVRALKRNQRPEAGCRMCMAPYWNCYENGVVCTGTMNIPRDKSIAAIDGWEDAFFQSEFTHAAGVRKHTHFPGGVLAMWQVIAGTKTFPPDYLVEQKQTLEEFVSSHDHSFRNNPE